MISVDSFSRVLMRIPVIRESYVRSSARLKRKYCIFMHRIGRLKPITFVQWLATFQCNFHCPYCEASAGKAADNELTTDEVKPFINDLEEMGVKRLVISGGEPLIRQDLTEIMHHATQKGIKLGLVTNGYLVEDLWEELQHFNYFLYFTSIDGLPAYNDKVRGKKNAFEKAMKGLELFKKKGVSRRMINTVVHAENFDQLEDLLNVLRHSAANLWHLTPIIQVGRAANVDAYALSGEQLRSLVDFIRKNREVMEMDLGESHKYIGCFSGEPLGQPFFCGAGLTRCSVMPQGEVLGCHQVYDLSFAEGNIRERPFSKIWKEEFRQFRIQKISESCKDCVYLSSCQGGCWAEMQKQKACLKSQWEAAG